MEVLMNNDYFDRLLKQKICKKSNIPFGETYHITPTLGSGNFERVILDDDIEIAILREANTYSLAESSFDCKDEFLEVGYVAEGQCYMELLNEDKHYDIKGHSIFIYRMHNDIETFNFSFKDCVSISIKISPQFVLHASQNNMSTESKDHWMTMLNECFGESVLLVKKGDDAIRNIFEAILSVEVKDAMSLITMKSLVLSLVQQIIERFQNHVISYEEEQLNQILEYIDEHLSETILLEDIGKHMNMSLYHIQKLFKQYKKCTVRQYIIGVRIKQSSQMLLETDHTILEIANECGYENPSKFASLFKKYHEISPLHYRKLYKAP